MKLLTSTLHLLTLINISLSYRIKDSENETKPFLPYEEGFVSTNHHDAYIPAHSIPNPGYLTQLTSIQNDTISPSRQRSCPNMIGPMMEFNHISDQPISKYYCTSPFHGYCDRRSGVCRCNQGYTGEGCEECDEFSFLLGGLCYKKHYCPNDCSNAGECDYRTGDCKCNEYRNGEDCAQFLCNRQEHCVECNQFECLKCRDGYSLNKEGNECVPCTRFDPRCNRCNSDECLACIDLLLLSIRRSGPRLYDPELPFDEKQRQLSKSIPFGSQSNEAFDEAEHYRIVSKESDPTTTLPLDLAALACDQGLDNDDRCSCRRVPVSNKICGHEGTIQWSSPEYTVYENEGHVRVKLVRTGGGVGRVQVSYHLHDITTDPLVKDVSPTALYTTNQTIVFEENVIEKTILLPIHNDLVKEAKESFELILHSVWGGAEIGNQRVTRIHIIDDEEQDCKISASSPIQTYLRGEIPKVQLKLQNCDTTREQNQLFAAKISCTTSGQTHFVYVNITDRFDIQSQLPSRMINAPIHFPNIKQNGDYFIEASQLAPQGLQGTYYLNEFMTNDSLFFYRIDQAVNLTTTHASIRWNGFISSPKSSGNCCSFQVKAEYYRLWIDQMLLLDEWSDDKSRKSLTTYLDFSLIGTPFVDVILEVRNSKTIILEWNATGEMTPIDSTHLHHKKLVHVEPIAISIV